MTLFCTVCTQPIPQERSDKGAVTCQKDCQTLKRKEHYKRTKEIRRQRLLQSSWFRGLVRQSARELKAVKSAEHTVLDTAQVMQ